MFQKVEVTSDTLTISFAIDSCSTGLQILGLIRQALEDPESLAFGDEPEPSGASDAPAEIRAPKRTRAPRPSKTAQAASPASAVPEASKQAAQAAPPVSAASTSFMAEADYSKLELRAAAALSQGEVVGAPTPPPPPPPTSAPTPAPVQPASTALTSAPVAPATIPAALLDAAAGLRLALMWVLVTNPGIGVKGAFDVLVSYAEHIPSVRRLTAATGPDGTTTWKFDDLYPRIERMMTLITSSDIAAAATLYK